MGQILSILNFFICFDSPHKQKILTFCSHYYSPFFSTDLKVLYMDGKLMKSTFHLCNKKYGSSRQISRYLRELQSSGKPVGFRISPAQNLQIRPESMNSRTQDPTQGNLGFQIKKSLLNYLYPLQSYDCLKMPVIKINIYWNNWMFKIHQSSYTYSIYWSLKSF